MAKYPHEADRRLGKALAERAGLDPATTLDEWGAESMAENRVLVKLTTMLIVSEAEWIEMYNEAHSPK